MKLSKLTLIAIFAFALGLTACGGASTDTTKSNAPAANNAPATQTEKKTETKTTALKMSTPSEANESLYNAIKAKDKASIRQLLSKNSMEIMDAAAKEKKVTFDELLEKTLFVNVTLPAKLEQRNEKITGDKGSVEMLSDKNQWDTTNFVKEDGVWKVALM